MRPALAALAVALAMATAGLPGGDPVAAAALYRWALTQSEGDFTHPVFVDASRDLARIRPWQPGYREARERLAAIEQGRRQALAP